MTLQGLKEELVVKQKQFTEKELTNLLIKFAISCVGISLDLSLVTMTIVGTSLTIAVILFTLLGFIWTLDLVMESDTFGKKLQKGVKLWFLPYIALVIIYLVLKLFRFV